MRSFPQYNSNRTDNLVVLENMSFKKTFLKNVLISGGYNYISQILTFTSSFITARLLLPDNYGIVGLITVFTGFISVFADGGISLAVIKSDYGRSYQKALDNLSLIIGVLLFCITTLLAYPIAWFYSNNDIVLPTIVLAITFIFRSMTIVRMAMLSKKLDFAYIGKVTLVTTTISIILTILLAYNHAEHWSLVIPQVVTSILLVILYESKIKLGFKLYSSKYMIIAFRYTKQTIGSLIGFNLINYWARNSDNLIVGKVYGTGDLGIYNRAYSLLTLPLSLVSGLMSTVLYPSLKKLKFENGDVNKEYLFVLRIISIIVFPITAVLVIFPHQIVSILWGEKWLKVSELLPYFGLLIYSQSILSTSGNILVLFGKERALFFSGLISSIFIISGIILGSIFSIVSIAQYYALFFIILVLPFNLFFIFYKSLQFSLKTTCAFFIPLIVLSLAVWFSCYYDFFYGKIITLVLMLVNILYGSKGELYTILKRYFAKEPVAI